MFRKNSDSISAVAVKGILVACLVLTLHVLLVVFLGFLVLFFRGIVNYMVWVFLLAVLVILLSMVGSYRKIKRGTAVMQKIIYDPKFKMHFFQVKFLWGLALVELGPFLFQTCSGTNVDANLRQIESYESSKTREITELAGLLERKLITLDEYNEAKKDIFQL